MENSKAGEWVVVKEGKPTGPYPLEELQNLSIRPGTFVKTSGMDDYKEAHEVPELRQLLGFRERIILPQYFATLDIRLLAVVIDYFIVSIGFAVPVIIALLFTDQKIVKIVLSFAWFLALPLVKMIYAAIMEGSVKQATFGKYWLGIKVCNEYGGTISRWQSFSRNASKILSFGTLGIGYISGFFNRKQQCLHDIVAGTLVVRGRLV